MFSRRAGTGALTKTSAQGIITLTKQTHNVVHTAALRGLREAGAPVLALEIGDTIEVTEPNGRTSRRVVAEIYEEGASLAAKATPALPLCARRNEPII
jgi:hypothetical protein